MMELLPDNTYKIIENKKSRANLLFEEFYEIFTLANN